MIPETFIAAIATHMYESVVQGEVEQLERPAGRRPAAESIALANWYAGLDAESRARVSQVIRRGLHAGIFGLLAVLDGVRRIDPIAGRFELTYVAPDGERVLLKAPGGEGLHDLFQSVVYESVFGSQSA